MVETIENKIFIFNLARKDPTSKHFYLVELAKDIVNMLNRIELDGYIHRLPLRYKESADEIKEFYFESQREEAISKIS